MRSFMHDGMSAVTPSRYIHSTWVVSRQVFNPSLSSKAGLKTPPAVKAWTSLPACSQSDVHHQAGDGFLQLLRSGWCDAGLPDEELF